MRFWFHCIVGSFLAAFLIFHAVGYISYRVQMGRLIALDEEITQGLAEHEKQVAEEEEWRERDRQERIKADEERQRIEEKRRLEEAELRDEYDKWLESWVDEAVEHAEKGLPYVRPKVPKHLEEFESDRRLQNFNFNH